MSSAKLFLVALTVAVCMFLITYIFITNNRWGPIMFDHLQSLGIGFKTKDSMFKCKRKELRLSNVSLPRTGLVSFPGSGNTWARELIQLMTGVGTSSIYCDKRLLKDFPFECSINGSLVIKSHQPETIQNFDKLILLVRNPCDAFTSYFRFLQGGGFHAKLTTRQVQIGRRRAFSDSLKGYRWMVIFSTIQFKKGIPVHVLQYEQLQGNAARELKAVADFLKVPVTREDLYCAINLQEAKYFSNKSDQDKLKLYREVYSLRELKLLKELQQKTEEMISYHFQKSVNLSGVCT